MKYGLPYKGSKNKLAPKIFELFPKRKNFYDLFGGICAILTVVFALCWGVNSILVPFAITFNLFVVCIGIKWYCEV